jgi:hypothetical protein
MGLSVEMHGTTTKAETGEPHNTYFKPDNMVY